MGKEGDKKFNLGQKFTAGVTAGFVMMGGLALTACAPEEKPAVVQEVPGPDANTNSAIEVDSAGNTILGRVGTEGVVLDMGATTRSDIIGSRVDNGALGRILVSGDASEYIYYHFDDSNKDGVLQDDEVGNNTGSTR